MINVPELIVAISIPRLVHERAHHLYCSSSAWTPGPALRFLRFTYVTTRATGDPGRRRPASLPCRRPGRGVGAETGAARACARELRARRAAAAEAPPARQGRRR